MHREGVSIKQVVQLSVPGVLLLLIAACSPAETPSDDVTRYTSLSRFTDPGEHEAMLDTVPADPLEISAVAGNLTVHHNLLPYFEVPRDEWPNLENVWPPRVTDVLTALEQSGPGDLLGERKITERVRSACMMESHLLTSMLRHRRIPVRIRAGYFRDVYTNEEHLVAFWEKNARVKGVAADLLETDPEEWLEVNHSYTRGQVAANKHVEHWIAQYWDEEREEWRLLDANNTFLKAMSDIDVGFHLPRRHFEFAWEAWQKMRSATDFNPDRYTEYPQDGRSHIRSQLLWDFYSLLNHDIAGYDNNAWPDDDSTTPERQTYAFVKETEYEKLSPEDLAQLDELAVLLARDPGIEELVAFYRDHPGLHIPTIGADPYSFVGG